MKNNKGQTLAAFLILIPILGLFMGFLFDIVHLGTEKRRMENVVKDGIQSTLLHHIDLESYLKENLKEITFNQMDIQEEKVTVHISKREESVYSVMLGRKLYTIQVSYTGTLKDGKVVLVKE